MNILPEQKRRGPVNEMALKNVTISDEFWSPRIEINHHESIRTMIDRFENIEGAPDPKLVEAVGYILQTNQDNALQARMDVDIQKLIDTVLPDGKPRAWKNLLNGEMYSAGHFMEAAAAYHQATGNQKVLDAAILLADDIDAHFGPGKRLDVSQHEELKIGLLKLYHLTGVERYLKLARFFLDERGHSRNGRELYGEYAQDHLPVIDQSEAVGHSVRATYLYAPLAEIAALTGDVSYEAASDRLWKDAAYKKTYLTGGIGTYRDHEDFGGAYELPTVSCYNETCASIGSVFWNYQMFSLHRDAKYIDMLERVLYNGFLSGVSLDGVEYFYQNPLKALGKFGRHPWFGPNCCPPNIVRLIASLGRYIYATSADDLYVNLFIGSTLQTEINSTHVEVVQETSYPWKGNVKITVAPQKKLSFTLNVRVPGWVNGCPMPGDLYTTLNSVRPEVRLSVNGHPVEVILFNGFVQIKRIWEKGDCVEIVLPMQVRKVISHELVADNAGLVALERGPIVYCAEGTDNRGDVFNLYIPDNTVIDAQFHQGMLGGIVKLTGIAKRVSRVEGKARTVTDDKAFVAVPYYAWANREPGVMTVWLARSDVSVIIPPAPTIASRSRVTSSCGSGSVIDNYPGGMVPDIATRFCPLAQSGSFGFAALYDQVLPVNSFDGSSTYLALRPQKGANAWVQYDFDESTTVQSVEVYWKDDKQYCRAPESWQLCYYSAGKWLPVNNISDYTVDKDRFNCLTFQAVKTEGLRLELVIRGQVFKKGELGPPDGNYMPADETWYETGIIEWKVLN